MCSTIVAINSEFVGLPFLYDAEYPKRASQNFKSPLSYATSIACLIARSTCCEVLPCNFATSGYNFGIDFYNLRAKFRKGIYAPEKAESNESVEKRALSFLASTAEKYTGEEKILVVTHNGFMRTLARLLGIKPVSNNLAHFTINLKEYTTLFR